MRVTILMRSQSGVPGGAGVPGGQIGMIQLARALARLDVQVELFAGGPRMRYLDGLNDVAAAYLRWPVWLDRAIGASPARVRAFGTQLRRRRWLDVVTARAGAAAADVIHVQGLLDTELLLTRLRGPLVVTHWGRVKRWQPGPDSDPALPQRIERIRDNVMLVAIGDAQATELTAAGLPVAEVIPPGIDRDHFRPGDRAQARQRLGLPANGGIVLYVGRLAADKNVGSLVRAFAQLPPHTGPARLIIVGDGPLRTELQSLCGTLGIGRSTTFLPFVAHHDLPPYYHAADVVAVPSDRLETFCMVALEAIACGCPLIVTDQVPEICQRFPAVPAVAPYDTATLGRWLGAAIDGHLPPADATRMADYDWSGVARRYNALYQKALRV